MRIYRISHFADLSGEGGRRASARWHHKGRPVVYCAGNAAAAILEAIAFIARDDPALLPSTFQLLEIELPDQVKREAVSLTQLPVDWKQDLAHTRGLGEDWLRRQATAVLVVPSALAPDTNNFLLNPAHPDLQSPGQAKIHIVRAERYPFDSRLFQSNPRAPRYDNYRADEGDAQYELRLRRYPRSVAAKLLSEVLRDSLMHCSARSCTVGSERRAINY